LEEFNFVLFVAMGLSDRRRVFCTQENEFQEVQIKVRTAALSLSSSGLACRSQLISLWQLSKQSDGDGRRLEAEVAKWKMLLA
jgi:hypothetical protein